MNINEYGVIVYTEDDICEFIYKDPNFDIDKLLNVNAISPSNILVDFNNANRKLHTKYSTLTNKVFTQLHTKEQFDRVNQETWMMPDEYKTMDIAKWVLDQCESEAELQRVGEELLLYQDCGMFDLLRFLKYFVDTMRKNKLVWGVGRGSSVASYVLFLIGVHKVNSLYYQLDVLEFFKK